jgi:transcription termination factor Rho
MHLSELKSKHVSELLDIGNAMEIEGANRMRKHDLIFALLKAQAKKGESMTNGGLRSRSPSSSRPGRAPARGPLAAAAGRQARADERRLLATLSMVN